MAITIGLGIIGGFVLLFSGVAVLAAWRRRRKEAMHRKERGGRPEAATLYPRLDQTGYDWRYRPDERGDQK
jgi:hypothetical protein